MKTDLLSLETTDREIVDLTERASEFVAAEGDGLLNVFAPHATVGLALMETGSGSESDLEDALDRLLPRDHAYRHSHGSPGHGADHLVPAFVAPSLSVPVVGGKLQLGTWQSIVMIDLNRDNPSRKLRLSFVEG